MLQILEKHILRFDYNKWDEKITGNNEGKLFKIKTENRFSKFLLKIIASLHSLKRKETVLHNREVSDTFLSRQKTSESVKQLPMSVKAGTTNKQILPNFLSLILTQVSQTEKIANCFGEINSELYSYTMIHYQIKFREMLFSRDRQVNLQAF